MQTLNRIIDVFPANQQGQVRTQLSFVLEAVFCQQLLPLSNGRGRILCSEVMVSNEAIKAMIRDDKAHQIYSAIQTGARQQMKTMNQALHDLYKTGRVTYDTALGHSMDPDDLKRLFQRTI